ncbi:MAG: effector-associated domain EAD1-containing protein, partial [Candidatus Promineifilaceae bacterium]
MARFTQEQYQLCFNGMRDTLNPGEIERLLRYELDLELENIVSGSQNKLAIIKAVIKHVEQNDLETQLVQALVKVRPRNKQFQKLKQQLQKTVSPHVEMSAHPDQQKA